MFTTAPGPTPKGSALEVKTSLARLPRLGPSTPLFARRSDGGLPWGLSDNAIDDSLATPQTVAAALHAAGADLVRLSLNWPSVERVPTAQDWSAYDPVYKAFSAQGIRIIWLLQFTPNWAVAPEALPFCQGAYCSYAEPTAEHLKDLGDFAARVALRYPLSGAIEYRNEPNVLGGDGQPKASPDAYVAGLRAVYQSVKKAGSRVRILGGALADNESWLDYLDRLLSDGAARWMDGLSFHPYTHGDDPTAFRKVFSDLAGVLDRNRASRLRIIPDEFGVSTTPTSDSGVVFDEAGQSEWLLAEYRSLDNPSNGWPLADRIDAALFFTTVEKPPASGVVGYGWLRPVAGRLVPKPVFCAFRREVGHIAAPFTGRAPIAACP